MVFRGPILQAAFLLFGTDAIAECSREQIVELLNAVPADVIGCSTTSDQRCEDRFGNHLLWSAIVKNDYHAANVLLDCGISVENQDDPLLLVLSSDFGRAHYGRVLAEDIKLLRRILQAGTSKDIIDDAGNSPFFIIIEAVCSLPNISEKQQWFEIRQIASQYQLSIRDEENLKVGYITELAKFGLYSADCISILLQPAI